MSEDTFYVPDSALAIVAHPDDIEFSCAGTLARWVRAGARVSYVLCTSGDVGIARSEISRSEVIEIREAEQRTAADIIGASEVVFLREPDGMLQPNLQLRKKLVREIRRFRPEVVLCGDPTLLWASENYINHPDHRAAAWAAVDAIFPASGQPHLFQELAEEGLTAFKPRKVFVMGRREGSVLISIDATIEDKIRALHAHESQFSRGDPAEGVRKRCAQLANGSDMSYAEAFSVVTLESDEDWGTYRGDVHGRK